MRRKGSHVKKRGEEFFAKHMHGDRSTVRDSSPWSLLQRQVAALLAHIKQTPPRKGSFADLLLNTKHHKTGGRKDGIHPQARPVKSCQRMFETRVTVWGEFHLAAHQGQGTGF